MQNDSITSNRKLLGVAGFAWLFDAMDVGLLSFVITALAKEWHLSVQQMGWIGSVNSIGMAVGALLFGLLADKIGRKVVFLLTLLLFSVGSGLSVLAPTLAVFLIIRFFIGMGLGGELPVASTLVSESVPTKERGKIVVLLESFWAGGWIVAALLAYFIIPAHGWKTAMLLSAIPAFYVLYLRLRLPDSPRFHLADQKQPWLEKVRIVWSASYTRPTIMLWVLWFSVVFSYYGMFLWLPSVLTLKGFTLIKSFEYVLLMTLAQLPGYFSAAWLVEKAGRKFVLIVYLLGTALSAYFFGQAATLPMLLTTGAFLSFFNLGAWGALYAYTPEQYPTDVRGTGAGMAASFGRVGGILGPLFVGYLVAQKVQISTIFLIFCISIIVGVLAVLFLGKETKQQELV